jgi:hypothetical protein
MEQLKKITETTDAEIEHLASIISAHGDRTDLNAMIRLRPPKSLTPRKPEWLVPSLVSMGTVTSALILNQLAPKILTTIKKECAGVQPSDPEDPVTEPPTTAPAGSQGIQDREVEAVPRKVFFATCPHPPS